MAIVLLVIAAVEDIRKCQIPNWLILTGLLLGGLINIRQDGYMGISSFVVGVLFPVLVLWLLFRFRVMGAGDIKLFSVIGGLYGASFVSRVMLVALFLGAVMSVFQLLRYQNLSYRLQYLAEFVSNYLKTGEIKPYYVRERDGTKIIVHFAVAILGSFLLCI